ncbi:MAG: HesA/MoeB/ThiF family protein [Desulfobacterales bacterium]|nr:HesA/MoeB/ThiF family protein [Desulfobacterales bacterium]
MKKKSIKDRYSRNLGTFSTEEQEQLKTSQVVVIGLGGLGGGVCEMLARTGVGRLKLIDGDLFDPSNLNRQLLSTEDLIGVPKAVAAKDRLAAVNSEVIAEHRVETLDREGMIKQINGADVVMDCLDSIDARFDLQAAARTVGVPIVSGAIAGVAGQVTTIFPTDAGYELIYGSKDHARSHGVETQTGNISYCALMVSAFQASECVKILLNRGELLRDKLLIAELWTNTFDVVDLC